MGRKRKTEEDYHKLAKNRGFKWVSSVLPKNTHAITLWECEKGHRWEAVYSSIKARSGCPICSNRNPKTKKDYNELAKSRGFKWVGGVLPKNINNPTWWECEKKDRWQATYNKLQQGRGCPICSNRTPKTKKDYNELAKSRGFKWVGGVLPKNIKDPTWWECEKGDRWLARYNNIQQGSSCPYCDDKINGVTVSKPQRRINNLLCGALNYPEGRCRIDVAIIRKSQKIAVEYDCQYWHRGKEEHDAKRDKFLISKGWKVLHIKSEFLLPTKKQLNIVINSLVETNNCIYNLYLEDWKT